MCKSSDIISSLTGLLSPASHHLLFPSFMKNMCQIYLKCVCVEGGTGSQARPLVSSLVAVKLSRRIVSSLSWVEEH